MPGQVGHFAGAGHGHGYRRPLGGVDPLQAGDPIIVSTKDSWYAYQYTRYALVLTPDVPEIAPTPEAPTANPPTRIITLTNCEQKYSTIHNRWISYGELE